MGECGSIGDGDVELGGAEEVQQELDLREGIREVQLLVGWQPLKDLTKHHTDQISSLRMTWVANGMMRF